MAQQLDCPVDFILVNENKVRLTAFLVLILGIIFLFTRHWAIPAFLALDFFMRAAKLGRYSLLNRVGELLVKLFFISNKPVDQAPKRFAAGIGTLFCTCITLSALLHFTIVAIVLTSLILVFASLESIAGFCAGCYVYTYYKKIF
jgi:hypothetical protein